MSGPGQLDEAGRLSALRGLDILDTGAEPGFDDIVALARALAGTEVALVTLIDSGRQWFKAKIGTDFTETPRSIAFCDTAIRGDETMVVPDATRDPRFADNPLVTGPPYVRFYAGAPIRTAAGHALGTVCVLDPRPRDDFDQADALAALARQAMALIELRRIARIDAAAREAVTRDLERLWTLTHDLILIADVEGGVIAANPAWQAIFGTFTAPGTLAMLDFLIDPATSPDFAGIADGNAIAVTREYRGHDGEPHTISWTLRREGGLIYGIGRDDTALLAAEHELVQAQKMESLGQLTGGIAHDFNNLLTIIVGNLDIATRRLGTGDIARVKRALSEAGEGASRATVLTQRLLAFARRQRLAPRTTAPATLLADMHSLIERAASDGLTVDILIEEGVGSVDIDVNQLENAILNLAVNARDAMAGLEQRGTLTISAGNVLLDPAEARRHGAVPGVYVRISVADTGTGMSAAVRARAFEPFFTTKGVGRGTGLGLSQVDGFVRQSGGFVTLDSAPGEGTIVHLWLPRSEHLPIDLPLAPALPATHPRGACVMVVEDNDALRELVVETLRDAGYRVIEAHDGRSALSLFARQSPPPDLVLSDVMMPVLDGFTLAAEVRVRSPGTRVLLMSGYAGAEATDEGEAVLLVKPFTPDALLTQVRAQLEVG